jgi:hypothetical protein
MQRTISMFIVMHHVMHPIIQLTVAAGAINCRKQLVHMMGEIYKHPVVPTVLIIVPTCCRCSETLEHIILTILTTLTNDRRQIKIEVRTRKFMMSFQVINQRLYRYTSDLGHGAPRIFRYNIKPTKSEMGLELLRTRSLYFLRSSRIRIPYFGRSVMSGFNSTLCSGS